MSGGSKDSGGGALGKSGLLSAVTSRRGTRAGVWQGVCGHHGESHRRASGLLSHRILASAPGNGEVRVVFRGGPDRQAEGGKNPLVSGAQGWEALAPGLVTCIPTAPALLAWIYQVNRSQVNLPEAQPAQPLGCSGLPMARSCPQSEASCRSSP